jgi:flavin reductase (DIM6/NTAB) family NADH-FMN oxidoreductase RutF
MKLDKKQIASLDNRYRIQLINSISGLKSAHLIGSINSNQQTNLAIVSSVFHLGADPALIGMIFRPDVSPRHSLENIRETKVCTLNHVNSSIYKSAHQTSARYPREVSEFDACDLVAEYKGEFKAPFVRDSNIQLALKLEDEKKIELNNTHMLIMSIETIYMKEDYLAKDGNVMLAAADSIAVGGLDSYYGINLITRLPYAKPTKSHNNT